MKRDKTIAYLQARLCQLISTSSEAAVSQKLLGKDAPDDAVETALVGSHLEMVRKAIFAVASEGADLWQGMSLSQCMVTLLSNQYRDLYTFTAPSPVEGMVSHCLMAVHHHHQLLLVAVFTSTGRRKEALSFCAVEGAVAANGDLMQLARLVSVVCDAPPDQTWRFYSRDINGLLARMQVIKEDIGLTEWDLTQDASLVIELVGRPQLMANLDPSQALNGWNRISMDAPTWLHRFIQPITKELMLRTS